MRINARCYTIFLIWPCVHLQPLDVYEYARNAYMLRHGEVKCPKVAKELTDDPKVKKFRFVADFEKRAMNILNDSVSNFLLCGSGSQHTMQENVEAFKRYRIKPKVLQDVGEREMCTDLLGTQISFPVGIAPTSHQKLASSGGEIDTAQAAHKAGTLMIMSTFSSVPMEDVAQAVPDGPRWHHIHIFQNRSMTQDLVERAQMAGYRALVVTVDTADHGRKLEKKFQNSLSSPHLRYGNLERYRPTDSNSNKNFPELDPSLTWKDLKWLQSITFLPIIIKGILTAEDAVIAASLGCEGIIVSNHGGRQLDNTPAAIEALPEVARSVRGTNVEVYMDGGIRNGTDIFMALSMGARAVFVGKPVLWGLAVAGENGVLRILERLRNEFELAMALAGVKTVKRIKIRHVARHKYYDSLWRPLG